MSWTKRIQHPSEVVEKSQDVEVVVLSIDVDQKRISLGLKQVEDDPWYQLAQKYAPGTEWEGKVTRLLDKGVVADLGNDIEGFVPVSQLSEDREIREPSEVVSEGDRLKLRVMESDPINRRIVLQLTEILERKVVEPEAPAAAPSAEPAASPEASAAEAPPEEPASSPEAAAGAQPPGGAPEEAEEAGDAPEPEKEGSESPN